MDSDVGDDDGGGGDLFAEMIDAAHLELRDAVWMYYERRTMSVSVWAKSVDPYNPLSADFDSAAGVADRRHRCRSHEVEITLTTPNY